MSGFPKGCADLERLPEWYDERHGQDTAGHYSAPAHKLQAADLIWDPALDLVRGAILDIGCGQGHLAELAGGRRPEVPYKLGIDVSQTAILLASTRTPTAPFRCEMDVKPTIAAGDYDTAVLLEVLEHVYLDLDLVRAVPAGKRLVASVPSFYTEGHCRWFASLGEVLGRYGDLVAIDAAIARSAGSNRWYIFAGTTR